MSKAEDQKNMKQLIFILTLAFGLTACGQQNGLKNMMVADPTTQEDKDKNAIIQYAIDNKMNLQTTESGMFYIMEKEGSGDVHPTQEDKITAHYHGTLLDGTVFDSSYDRGEPFTFSLGGVINGWKEAIPMLTKGGKGKFFIPSNLGYGNRPAGKIPPNSVLVFDIELVDFMDPETARKAELEKMKGAIAKEAATMSNYAKEKGLAVQTSESGIQYNISKEGSGDNPTTASLVTAHYHGTLLDGTVFDSSVDRGEPITFRLGQVIRGWQEAIPMLKKGGKGTFIIPSPLAYGPRQAGKIPPNSPLVFEIELVDFK